MSVGTLPKEFKVLEGAGELQKAIIGIGHG